MSLPNKTCDIANASGILHRANDAWQQSIHEGIPGLVFVYSLVEKELRYINKEFVDTLGYSYEEVTNWKQDLSNLIFKEDLPFFQQQLDNICGLQPGVHLGVPYRLKMRGGDSIQFHVTGCILQDINKREPTHILFFAQNIALQVLAKEQSRTCNDLVKDTENILQFATWTLDAASGKEQWSDGVLLLLNGGRAGMEPIITSAMFLDHVVEADRARVDALHASALENKQEYLNCEYAIETHDKKTKVIQSNTRFRYDNGKLLSALGIVRDITEEAKSEEELERKITELKRSNKDLEEFAYIASHDMHEPLRKVHSFADRLKTKYSVSVEEEAKGYLDRILAATQSARQMIDGLMEFSRLSRNGYGFEKVDLNGLVSEVLNDLELKIEETNTTVVVEKLPTIEVIRIQLKQLFNNVILNAIKFRKEGTSARIVIRSMRLAQNEIAGYNLNNNLIYWKLTIEDSGIGFEEEYAETIFQMFQRLNGKSEYPGSGIGLALCKKITDNHHGGIAAKGVVGEGTVITVVLPEKNIT